MMKKYLKNVHIFFYVCKIYACVWNILYILNNDT